MKRCKICKIQMVRRKGEKPNEFTKRKTCSAQCGHKLNIIVRPKKKCICGNSFIQRSAREQFFCSVKCSHVTKVVSSVECKCTNCGKIENLKPNKAKRYKFCSQHCAQNAISKEKSVILKCARCGNEFSCPEHRKEKAKFCSLNCYHPNTGTGIRVKKCLVCRNEFKCRPGQYDKKKTCSLECAKRTRGYILHGEYISIGELAKLLNIKCDSYLSSMVKKIGLENVMDKYLHRNSLT